MKSNYFKIIPWTSGELYSGIQLTPNYFRSKTKVLETGLSSIMFWNGPVDVAIEHMKDIDDVRENLSIKSSEMTNIVIQLQQWTDPVTATFIQRTLCRNVMQNINLYLEKSTLKDRCEIDGNDIYLIDRSLDEPVSRKLSVSIVSAIPNCAMIHFGYNVKSTEAPEGVVIGALDQLGMSHLKDQLVRDIIYTFNLEFEDVVADAYKSFGR